MKKIITVGNHVDIDAYAGNLAYAKLLNLLRKDSAEAVFQCPPNYSVPENLRIRGKENLDYTFAPDDELIVLDVSDSNFIAKLVPENQITEIIDHHPGGENFWHERLGEKSQIEPIGATCTIIFERWRDAEKLHEMPAEIAKLLMAGILDNTLNFNAGITKNRDHEAYENLAKIAHENPENFAEKYFADVAKQIEQDLRAAILGDIKIMNFQGFGEVVIGQITCGRAEKILKKAPEIRQIMHEEFPDKPHFFVNIIAVEEGKNYMIVSDEIIAKYLQKLLDAKDFSDGILTTNRLFLRKEITKIYLEKIDKISNEKEEK